MKRLVVVIIASLSLMACGQNEMIGKIPTGETSSSVQSFNSTVQTAAAVSAEDVENLSDEEVVKLLIEEAEEMLAELKKQRESASEKEQKMLDQIIKDHTQFIEDLKANETMQQELVKMIRNMPKITDEGGQPKSPEELEARLCEDLKKMAEDAPEEIREQIESDAEACENGEGPLASIGELEFPKELCDQLKKDIDRGNLPSQVVDQIKSDYNKNCQ